MVRFRFIAIGIVLFCLFACCTQPSVSTAPDPVATAEAQATAIVQNARATAIIALAQEQATVLAAEPAATQVSPASTNTPVTRVESGVSPQPDATSTAVAANVSQTMTAEIVRVSIVPDSGLIQVQFKAAPSISGKWQYWNVYVVDEATGTSYNDIPDVPLIGRLLAKPQNANQLGYVMFNNTDGKLRKGGVVTVVLGDFKQEHIQVQ
jgi:hypothetical protein